MYHDLSIYNQVKIQRAVRMAMQYMGQMMPRLHTSFLQDLSFIERLEESEVEQINKQAALDKVALEAHNVAIVGSGVKTTAEA